MPGDIPGASASVGHNPGPGGRFQVAVDFGAQFLPLRVVEPVLPLSQGFPGADHQVMIRILHGMERLAADISRLLHGHNPQLPQELYNLTNILPFDSPLQQYFDHGSLLGL